MKFNIFFRAFKAEDAAFINNLRKDDDIEQMLMGPKRFVSLAREEKWVNDLIMNDNPSVVYVAICEKVSDEIIGYTALVDIDFRNGTCFGSGIKITKEKAGKGYGIQAILLLYKYVFEELRLVRVSTMALEDHRGSLLLLQRAGFKVEGLLRKYIFKNGKHNNCWLVSTTDEDFKEIKEKQGI